MQPKIISNEHGEFRLNIKNKGGGEVGKPKAWNKS